MLKILLNLMPIIVLLLFLQRNNAKQRLKTFEIMKLQIHLRVFMTSQSEKPCFERVLNVDSFFDYDNIVSSMFALYGNTCLISFKICQ